MLILIITIMENKMEEYFLISEFEDGYDIEDLAHEDAALEYCSTALYIPIEKIQNTSLTSEGLELSLFNLNSEDIQDDWFVNLCRISTKL